MSVESTSSCASSLFHPPVSATVTSQGVFCTIRGGDTALCFEEASPQLPKRNDSAAGRSLFFFWICG